MASFKIEGLVSGGLITNYYCTSKCRHCLYNCSQAWPKHYISKDNALEIFQFCMLHNCTSLHIGGGEPFLNKKSLLDVAEAAQKVGMHIEYVETNSSWYVNEGQACKILDKLLSFGITTLLISISPFHLEYIPLKKVFGVMDACKKTGMGIFPWSASFLNDFLQLDPNKTYSFSELEKIFGKTYISTISSKYWIHPGGRALNYFFSDNLTLDELLEINSLGCKELVDTSHFHFDLYDNFIPGLCAGLSIRRKDLFKDIKHEKYPILSVLFNQGIRGLFEFAQKYGFNPQKNKKYGSKCTFCFEIRKFFIEEGKQFPELQPIFHYLLL